MNRRTTAPALLAAGILLCTGSSTAGDDARRVTALRTAAPPVIDGYFSEAEWSLAEPATGFLQLEPKEGDPATEPTEVRILYDDEAIYFGCRMMDGDPEKIVARLARRDYEIEADQISIRIDSFHDHQTAFEFTVLASGTKVDIIQFNDGANEDDSWDAVWDVRTRIFTWGWAAEIRIPFSQLRFSQTGEWGVNFRRIVNRKNEVSFWVLVPKSEAGFVSRFGHLEGFSAIPQPGRLEVLPYVLGRVTDGPASPVNPDGTRWEAGAGLDLKYGLAGNLTFNATVNPDFGQVEADPAVLNLTTFETFYPEKRPFFIEGAQIINFTTFGGSLGPGLFYSRRIGRPPSIQADTTGGRSLREYPATTTILGAAKLTGKTAGGLSIGALSAVTAEEEAVVVDSLGREARQVVAPLSSYNVLRLRQDVLQNSNIGGALTAVARRGGEPAFTGGLDWKLRFDRSTYLLNGFIAGSSVPRADGRAWGSAGNLGFSKEGGEHWLYGVSADYTTRRYDINDIGFFMRPNDYGTTARVTYKEDRPGDVVRLWRAGLNSHFRWTFDRVNLTREVGASAVVTLTNYWEFFAGFTRTVGRVFDDRETRGNGIYERPGIWTFNAEAGTDDREHVVARVDFRYQTDDRGAHSVDVNPDLVLRPLSNVEVILGLRYVNIRGVEAWVANVAGTGGETWSVFADRDAEQMDIMLRGAFTFTRDLTFELYSQLFVGKGHYTGFRRLIANREFAPFDYEASSEYDNPDFNFQPFNLNAVLRWEYLPGSTLYLVWTQARENETDDYFTSLKEDLGGPFRAPATNVLLLKVSYWLNL